MSRPLLVATVAAPTMAELRRRRDAVEAVDLIELRLDHVRDPDATAAVADRRLPVVVTCRAKWEGGHFDGSEVERRKILECALALGAEYVDVEAKASFARDLIASTGGKRIVISTHDYEGVPADLIERVRAMRTMGAEIVKVAITARSLADNLRLLQLERSGKTVLVAMGPVGVATRVLAAHFHSFWSYAGDGFVPGQLPATRMLDEFRFRGITDRTDIYGVVGSPLTHSISPSMHNAAFRAARADAVYLPLVASSAEDFTMFATALGVKGASITIPYKVDLFQRADDVDDLSRKVGAVNTYRRDGARWEARNTDVSGFLTPLIGKLDLRGARAAVLGTGGASRAVAVALESAGSHVVVYGRSRSKADAVARIVDGVGAVLPVPAKSWDLLVNTTPVGMYPDVDGTPFEGPFDGSLVYDLVYNPVETRLMKDAASAGCATIGGLDMLVAQAEDQSEWWLGRRPPVNLLRQAALAAL
ncbi:MAG TPA: type I 3-dehydroquinate dehydratase [Vicinamibacterales bacterium]|nr:type I 3-dehydroquinate dehydratase [Vicinamibacterales bacterium]